jgi:hypothetical protein
MSSGALVLFRVSAPGQETCRSSSGHVSPRLRAALITWSGRVYPYIPRDQCRGARIRPVVVDASFNSTAANPTSQPRSKSPIRDSDWPESRIGRPTTVTITVIPSLQRRCRVPNRPAEAGNHTHPNRRSRFFRQFVPCRHKIWSRPFSIPPKPRSRASPHPIRHPDPSIRRGKPSRQSCIAITLGRPPKHQSESTLEWSKHAVMMFVVVPAGSVPRLRMTRRVLPPRTRLTNQKKPAKAKRRDIFSSSNL